MKIVKVMLSLCLITATSYGQTEIGIKAGLNVSDIVMTNYVNPDVENDLNLKLGLHAGVFAGVMIEERIGLSAELLYSDKGVKGNTNIHLHYFAVPALVTYKLNERFSVEAGPEVSYLFSARSAHGDLSGTYNNRFDLSIDGGIRFDAARVVAGLRYCIGLFSVRDPAYAQGLSGPEKVKYQNRVVQLSLGYKLHLSE